MVVIAWLFEIQLPVHPVLIPLRQGVLDTTLCDKVCQLLVVGRWFSPCISVSYTNKTDCRDITEAAFSTITLTLI